MTVDVLLVPCEFAGRARPERTAVVVDVIRATSSIVSAFEHGCTSILPAESADEARSLLQTHPDALLCGERKGKRIEGFRLGNSPREFTREAVAGKALILATSNGTRTLRAVSAGRAVAIGALMNRTAVAAWLRRRAEDALLICSGYEGIFSLEDAVCAGGIAEGAAEAGMVLGDGAEACRILWRRYSGDLPGLLRQTAWGRHIVAIGLGPDLDACARLDTTRVVPVLEGGLIRAEPFA
jgi:2-phosphosulfolactate phosphatase